jgi:hypothetical protein
MAREYLGAIMSAIGRNTAMAAKDEKDDFDAFVKRQQQHAVGTPVDWTRERDEWLRHLGELYEMIESFLKGYTTSGAIKLGYKSIQLNEENIGTYEARQMTLKIGQLEITLKPVGTLIIGAKGRVDVVGHAGRARFLLVDKDASRGRFEVTIISNNQAAAPSNKAQKEITWTWKIATPPPRVDYIELTQESLYRTLMEVVNA